MKDKKDERLFVPNADNWPIGSIVVIGSTKRADRYRVTAVEGSVITMRKMGRLEVLWSRIAHLCARAWRWITRQP